MLSAEQLRSLESLIQRISHAVHIDEASLEPDQSLRLVLCNDTICFRPLHISAPEVDIPAVLAGQPAAQQALLQHVRSALPGIV